MKSVQEPLGSALFPYVRGELTTSTLFWGGSTYAPKFQVKDRTGKKVNIQDFLQSSFLAAVEKLANAVGDLDGVLGIEVSYLALSNPRDSKANKQLMNEPHPGFIGIPSIHEWVSRP